MALKKLQHVIARFRQLIAESGSVLAAVGKRRSERADSNKKRVTFVQFGDYEEAFWRFERGEPENYYAQKYSVDFVGSLASQPTIESVTVICVASAAKPAVLPNGVRTVGIQLYSKDHRDHHSELLEILKNSRPTHLIAVTPSIPLISWAVRTGCQVLPMLADSFRAKGLKAAVEYKLLGVLFNARAIQFVANHNLAASLDLIRIGVAADKVLPFDWPAVISPRDFQSKHAASADHIFRVIFAGAVIESKGVGDIIDAVSILHSRNVNVSLTIIGRGDIDAFKTLAAQRHVQDFVFFLGPRSHDEVIAGMRSHDAVVVPSHWSYPEGLPMTLYEALCTRTPLLTSDHPMFALKIRDRYNALVFPERNAAACANCIEELLRSPALYAQLSANALAAADEYLCALKYDQLVSAFLGLNGSIDLRQYSLARSYPAEVERSRVAA